MDRRHWDQLPEGARRVVESRCGPVVQAEPAPSGVNNAFAGTLHLRHGTPVFCKGIPDDVDPWTLAMFDREAAIGPDLPADVSPRLLWDLHADGWRLLGFEYVEGRPADFAPGSSDLPLVAQTLRTLATSIPAPTSEKQQLIGERLAGIQVWNTYLRKGVPEGLDSWASDNLAELAAREAAAPAHTIGDTLLHTDLNSHNWIIGPAGPRIVDWSWTARGAAWVEVEFLAPRLLAAGHTPRDVERWADSVHETPPPIAGSAAFAVALAGIWTHRAMSGGFNPAFADAAREWARHQLALT
ncbi:hypothetical protein [Amycolatopsis kentuckyensis]|uniref:hypothetical protein n=1 Tax=Amycolatopsis kentuckyensis TaxID=218823 RepID=UPI003565D816